MAPISSMLPQQADEQKSQTDRELPNYLANLPEQCALKLAG
jgi:hypothetical protein